MKKQYFYITLFFLMFSLGAFAQENKGGSMEKHQQTTIEGLNIYPNPVSSDRVYITSKSSLTKEIVVYDATGKKVLQTTITGKELNISSLTTGIYMITIKEGEATATRKLIVK